MVVKILRRKKRLVLMSEIRSICLTLTGVFCMWRRIFPFDAKTKKWVESYLQFAATIKMQRKKIYF